MSNQNSSGDGDVAPTLAEELERVQFELRQQVLNKSRRTDDAGLYNLDVSSMVSYDQSTEVEDREPVNKIKTLMRACFSNEIKSAKELKIYLKGEQPLYYPVVVYNTNPLLNPSKLDMRSKKPIRAAAVGDQNGQMNMMTEGGFSVGYCDDLDRWLLTHQPIFEDPFVNRGVCRLYAILVSETMNKFIVNASSGFVTKIKDKKFVVSTLATLQCNDKYSEFYLEKPLVVASFGNLDLLKPLNNILNQIIQNGQITRQKVNTQLLDDFGRCLVKVKANKVGIAARKEWLIANSRCSEVLDSEFYYQMLPSLDICLFNISSQWLKDRQIRGLRMMKPDWRYLTAATIGFSCPRALQFKEWRAKYGQSRGVPKEEGAILSQHKMLSVGKVKSYGSITCVQNTAGLGAQGSPVFNELGKCWGFLIGSYNDIPAKMENEIQVPNRLNMPGGGTLQTVPLTTKELKRKRRKEKKREKKRREKERKKRIKDSKSKQVTKPPLTEADSANAKQEQDQNGSGGDKKSDDQDEDLAAEEPDEQADLHPLEMPKIDSDNTDSNGSDGADNPRAQIEDNNLLGDTYFDVKSDHCLMPLLAQHNAYNRNMVLSMGHSGVKFVIEKISKSLESEFRVNEGREKIIERHGLNGERAPVKIDQGLLDDAKKMGREGILTSMVLFDMNKKEASDMAQRNLLEYKSTGTPSASDGISNQQTNDQTEGNSAEGESAEVSIRKVRHGNQLVTETVTEGSREKLAEMLSGPVDKRPKLEVLK